MKPPATWWIAFPRLRCPNCGKPIVGVKFVGRWKLPRLSKKAVDAGDREGESTAREEAAP